MENFKISRFLEYNREIHILIDKKLNVTFEVKKEDNCLRCDLMPYFIGNFKLFKDFLNYCNGNENENAKFQSKQFSKNVGYNLIKNVKNLNDRNLDFLISLKEDIHVYFYRRNNYNKRFDESYSIGAQLLYNEKYNSSSDELKEINLQKIKDDIYHYEKLIQSVKNRIKHLKIKVNMIEIDFDKSNFHFLIRERTQPFNGYFYAPILTVKENGEILFEYAKLSNLKEKLKNYESNFKKN